MIYIAEKFISKVFMIHQAKTIQICAYSHEVMADL